jgi:hypothetical protein
MGDATHSVRNQFVVSARFASVADFTRGVVKYPGEHLATNLSNRHMKIGGMGNLATDIRYTPVISLSSSGALFLTAPCLFLLSASLHVG